LPLPQAHAPAVEHESASPAVQVAQAIPAGAHADAESAVQAPLCEQHPLGQDVASQVQTPSAQCRPAAHGAFVPHRQVPLASHVSAEIALQLTQVAPAAPHATSERVSQVLPLQQPPGHEAALQPSPVEASHPAQVHAPFTQLCPGGHERPPAHAGPRLP
jgi:hypothetical protein